MEQSPGLQQSKENPLLVCNFLNQFTDLNKPFRSGFVSSKADSFLFLWFTNDSTMFLLVYVDDIIVKGSSVGEIQTLVS